METERKCGFRKIGGLYLVGDALGFNCPAMPIPITPCSCCGHEIEFFRGYKTIDSKSLLKDLSCPHECPILLDAQLICPILDLSWGKTPVGLMWIGDRYYTPSEFITEAKSQGISKRISAIPRGFKLGETWVFLAHRKAIEGWKEEIIPAPENQTGPLIQKEGKCFSRVDKPGIFYAFKPTRIELVITADMQELDWVQDYIKQSVTPVVVDDMHKHKPATRQRTKRHQYMDSLTRADKVNEIMNELNDAGL